jgi:hypothetical protein
MFQAATVQFLCGLEHTMCTFEQISAVLRQFHCDCANMLQIGVQKTQELELRKGKKSAPKIKEA